MFFFGYIILFLKFDKYFCNKIDYKIIIDEYDVNNIFSYLYILLVLWRKLFNMLMTLIACLQDTPKLNHNKIW